MKNIIPVFGLLVSQTAFPADKPNIIIILADDLGYGELGCYGSKDIITPNIDRLASQGVRFTSFYANAPECTPTRAALLTGRYQQRVGGLECAIGAGNVGRYNEAAWLREKSELGLPAESSVLSAGLNDKGYNTANIGKWHLGYEEKFYPKEHKFDYSFGPIGYGGDHFFHVEQDGIDLPGFTGKHTLACNGKEVFRDGYYSTHLFTDEAKSWINKQNSQNPFFLYLTYTAPHFPVQDPDDYTGVPKSASDWSKFNKESYNKMINELDRGVGEILEMLERKNLAENTIVIFFSDNGGTRNADNGNFRGFKGQLFEGGIRVPCIVKWPGKVPAGKVSDQVTIGFDLSYSALVSAGIAADKLSLDGFDIIGHLINEKNDFDRTLFWRTRRGDIIRKATRDGNMKYIVEYSKGEETDAYLFNLGTDPSETNNLLESDSKTTKILKQKIADWEKEVQAIRLADLLK